MALVIDEMQTRRIGGCGGGIEARVADAIELAEKRACCRTNQRLCCLRF